MSELAGWRANPDLFPVSVWMNAHRALIPCVLSSSSSHLLLACWIIQTSAQANRYLCWGIVKKASVYEHTCGKRQCSTCPTSHTSVCVFDVVMSAVIEGYNSPKFGENLSPHLHTTTLPHKCLSWPFIANLELPRFHFVFLNVMLYLPHTSTQRKMNFACAQPPIEICFQHLHKLSPELILSTCLQCCTFC